MMRVVVTGGRYFDDAPRLFGALDTLHQHRGPITCVIQGGGAGADELARSWAVLRRVPFDTYPADWTRLGRSAGPIRNREMLERSMPDVVVAFEGGAGTADTVRRALRAEIEIIEVEPVRGAA